jgi:hypothetical protein
MVGASHVSDHSLFLSLESSVALTTILRKGQDAGTKGWRDAATELLVRARKWEAQPRGMICTRKGREGHDVLSSQN